MRKFVKWFALGFSLICLNYSASSQNPYSFEIDSIKLILKSSLIDSAFIENLLWLSEYYAFSENDSAVFYLQKAVKLAKENDLKRAEATALYDLSVLNIRMSKYQDAIDNLQQSASLFLQLKDSTYLAGCYNNLGVVYSYGAEQEKSLGYFIKAMRTAEAIADSFALSEAYLNIGTYYELIEDFRITLRYYKKALDIYVYSGLEYDAAIMQIYIATVYTKLFQYNEARVSLEKAKPFLKNAEDPFTWTALHSGLIDYYLESDQLDSALLYIEYMFETVGVVRQYPGYFGILNLQKAKYFKEKKQYQTSLEYFQKAEEIFNQNDEVFFFIDLYESMSEVYSKMGIQDQAFEKLQQAKEYEQYLKPVEFAKQLGELENEEQAKVELLQYKAEQQRIKENEMLKAKIRFILIIAILFGFIVLGIIYIVLKQRSNRKLKESYKKLEISEQKLKETNATKDKFFSIIAHDLKNPFNVIIGISDIMKNNPELKNTREFDSLVEGMLQTATSGHDLLVNLLEWARTQTKSIKYEPKQINLQEIFTNIQSFFYERAKVKEIEIVIPKDKVHAYADYNMINFIIRNLLDNAIKFSYKGGRIEVSVTNENKSTIVSVKDFGKGMSETVKPKLFQMSENIRRQATGNETGTGLGLILCKEFIEINKGKIWLESKESKGSTFYFSLPSSE